MPFEIITQGIIKYAGIRESPVFWDKSNLKSAALAGLTSKPKTSVLPCFVRNMKLMERLFYTVYGHIHVPMSNLQVLWICSHSALILHHFMSFWTSQWCQPVILNMIPQLFCLVADQSYKTPCSSMIRGLTLASFASLLYGIKVPDVNWIYF